MGKVDPDSYLDEEEHAESSRYRRREARMRRARVIRRGDRAALEEVERHGVPEGLAVAPVFIPTLSGSHWERWWISNYLGPFHREELITDVLRQVRGGKEATVYCCAAHPATGLALAAAKVYRPRFFRQLRNDAEYRQGRRMLDATGREVRDHRHLRAVAKGTRVGKEVQHTSWMAHEYQTLCLLHEAGVDVPRPLAMGDNAILMAYVGDLDTPAPTLNQVTLGRREARAVYERLLWNVERMLEHSRVHADLSAYNVLYWQGQVRLIDFPQAVDPRAHPDAYPIFQRDLARLCRYFRRYGIKSDAGRLAEELWTRHCAGLTEERQLLKMEMALQAEMDAAVEE
jgi:RIO kinase 1